MNSWVDVAEMTGQGIAALIPAVFGGLAALILFRSAYLLSPMTAAPDRRRLSRLITFGLRAIVSVLAAFIFARAIVMFFFAKDIAVQVAKDQQTDLACYEENAADAIDLRRAEPDAQRRPRAAKGVRHAKERAAGLAASRAVESAKVRELPPGRARYGVMFSGLSDTAGQKSSLLQQTKLAAYWMAICRAAGAPGYGAGKMTRPELLRHLPATVIGYTPSGGRAAYNLALSRGRAPAVTAYLTAVGVASGLAPDDGDNRRVIAALQYLEAYAFAFPIAVNTELSAADNAELEEAIRHGRHYELHQITSGRN